MEECFLSRVFRPLHFQYSNSNWDICLSQMIIVSTTTETLYYLWHKITNTIPIKIHAFMYNKWLDSANEIKWILGNLGSFVKKREGNIGSSNTYNWVIDILLFMFGMCLVYICAICGVFCLYWSGIWATSQF
jgi:hypothetical protein